MQMDNLRKGPQVDSFRRGVASQKLLRDLEGFDGIAKIEAAFEIPPSVIMEFVEGISLEEAASKPDFDFWTSGVEVLLNICGVILAAHKSRYGVLHRDVRPNNIMLPNYYLGDAAQDHGKSQFSVKLLNYDLTWHKDAGGRVIPADPAAVGYIAPELLEEPDGTRARDARVDSYGIGMTAFRLSAGKNPPIGGSKSNEWFSYLSLVKRARGTWFAAAHNYVARLIERATRESPSERLLISDLLAKLLVLQSALKNDPAGTEGTILAENLMYSISPDEYEANSSWTSFSRNLGGFRTYELEFVPARSEIVLLFKNTSINFDNWSSVDKVWSGKLTAAKEILQSGGWKINGGTSYTHRVITLSASIETKVVSADYNRVKDSLERAIQRVQTS